MAARSMFPFFDDLYDGRLCETLADWTDEGLSLDQMVDRILAEKQIGIGRETLRRWRDGECS
jgi:hypothetical protein